MFYLSCKLLLLNFFFSGCNTLLHPNQFIQLVSLFFYGFDEYIFPLYSFYSVSNSYIEKLGRNGCILACLYGSACLKSLLISKKTKHANIANMHTIITKSSLDIQPKMHLLSKLIEHKDNIFLYSASLKLKNKDNLISKFCKWIAFHTDDISLSNISDLALKKNSLEIPEADEINRINNAREITVDDILAMDFYKNPIFAENCNLKQKMLAKCQNYMCYKSDDKLNHITSKNKNLVFIPVDNLPSNNSGNYLINLLNKYKAIVVEGTRQKFAPQETIVNDEHNCFGIVNNKVIYYLFLGFNFTDRNSTTFTRLIHTLPQTLFWCLALGNLSFSYQPCLIIKFVDVDKLIDVLEVLIDFLNYDLFKINIYGVSKLIKKKHNEN